MYALFFCSLIICFALSGWVFLLLQNVPPKSVHRFVDWLIAGCPVSWPYEAIYSYCAKQLAKMVKPHLEPLIILDDKYRVHPKWANPHAKHQKCLHSQRTKAIAQAETLVYETSKLRMESTKPQETRAQAKPAPVKQAAPKAEPKPIAPGCKLDPETAALDNCGLQDMLKALGCRLPRNVGSAADYRKALLAAVEGALYRPTKKVKV